jgi:hypothetical protein
LGASVKNNSTHKQGEFMSNRRDNQFFYTPHNKATLLDCSFVVDSTNGNGLGIRSLKGSGRVSSVFMHTTATPGVSSDGITNPNPAAGYIVANLQDNYARYLGGFSGFVTPVSGTPILVASAGTVANTIYVIVSLGTTTIANWHALGVPSWITPAVGVSFVAAATTTKAGTGAIEVIKSTGAGSDHIEVVGDANLMNATDAYGYGGSTPGMQIIMVCFNAGSVANPADGAVIGLSFYMNNSSFGV